MVFSNLGEVNTYEKTYQMADAFIKDTTAKVTRGERSLDSSKATNNRHSEDQKIGGIMYRMKAQCSACVAQ